MTVIDEVLSTLERADEPMTAKELAEICGHAKVSTNNELLRLYRWGLVIRRPRMERGAGRNPYEYRIKPEGTPGPHESYWGMLEGE